MEDNTKFIEYALMDFDNAIASFEALQSYYSQTRDSIINRKINFEKKYETALKLSLLMDKIYEQDIEKRATFMETIIEEEVQQNILFKDIINLSLVNDNSQLVYSLCEGYQNSTFDPATAQKKKKNIYNQENIFTKSILSNIIISFEQYLSAYYCTLVMLSPKCYFEDKKISVCDLLDGNIGEIIKKLIDREVESNMFDSLKVLDKIKDKSSIDIDRFFAIRKEFEEVYYRRNIFVHNNGIVNEIYLEKANPKPATAKIGERLICDNIYLENSILLLYKVVVSLHYEILCKLNANQEQFDSLADLGFEALKSNNYTLAEFIYGLLRKHRGFEFLYKAMYEVNYINALKLQGKEIEQLLSKFDVSIATDNYKIAKECLYDNHEKVYEMLTHSYPDSFSALMIRDWPLFIKFRETHFYERFINDHREDFDRFVFENELDES